ncbi:MAG TPA: YbjN domain-containing protein [Mycobacteriales bacterium]|nr:YbjN domain-containing protein [Mycobacteriales bacterium]
MSGLGHVIGRDPAEVARYDALVRDALDGLGLEYEHVETGAFLVKLAGQHKLATMTWLVVGDHTLLVEAFFLRRPEGNHGETYAFLLQRNARTYGVHFSCDRLGDVYLVGHVPLASVTAEEVDRLLGCVLEYSDGSFDAALRLGFAESIRREEEWRARQAAETGAPARPIFGGAP